MNGLDFQDGMRCQQSCLQLLCRPELRDALISLMNAAAIVRLRLVPHQKIQRAFVESSVLCTSRTSWQLVALRGAPGFRQAEQLLSASYHPGTAAASEIGIISCGLEPWAA